MPQLIRIPVMILCLFMGYWFTSPSPPADSVVSIRFQESAERSHCLNVHTPVTLSDQFANIMPWLASVGAAAAAGDFDNDGFADLYVTNSGRGQPNRLFRNRGDGTFEDVTVAAGVGCGNLQGASMHAIWGDVNNDGHLDLYVVKWADHNTLFLNNGDGTFTGVSVSAGVDYWGYANGATFLDYDRDGRLDILVGNYFSEKVLDPKTGNWVRNDLWNPVTTRVMHETFTHARNGGRNVLYRNRGDGTFEDVTEAVGLIFTGWTLAVGAGDLNNDRWPDLYLANDFGPDELYLNTGATEYPPKFRLLIDPAGHPGVGNDWWKGMNVDMGDVNNDGHLDIYVTNILQKRYKTDEGNMLWLNVPDARMPGGRGFRNIAKASGTFDGGWGWGGKFADFNNDGLLDIYTVNGFVTGSPERNYWFAIQEMVTQTKNQTVNAADWPAMGDRDLSGRERGRLFLQVPPERTSPLSEPLFVECAARAGITDVFNGRGIALADYNLDGWIDMYVANQGAPACYYINRTGDRKADKRGFMRLTLTGAPEAGVNQGGRIFASTRDAVGARVELHTSRGRQMREVQGGMGFASQSEFAVHFGVPDPDDVQRVVISWPSGREQVFEGGRARAMINRSVTIHELDDEVAFHRRAVIVQEE